MFQPNSLVQGHLKTSWHTPKPDSHQLVSVYRAATQWIVTLYEGDATGTLIPYEGVGQTVRAAYHDADHQRRRSHHTIEGLLKKRRKSVRRALDYRAKLKLAGHCLDMTCVNYETELDALRDEKEDLERDLTAVRVDKMKAEREITGLQARVRDLEFSGNEKDRGMDLLRQAFAEAGITQGNLLERVKQLAAERDQYRQAAQQNAAATV